MTHRSPGAPRVIPIMGMSLLLIAGAAFCGQEAGRPAARGLRVIETSFCTLRLDAQTADLVGLAWKEPRVEVIQEARLGENFRILLPQPGFEANYFTSRDQKVARIQETAEGVTCFYESLRNKRGTVDVKVRYHIRALDGRVEFSIEVDNPTDLPLAEVYFGIIGGQQGLVNRLDTESLVPGWVSNMAPSIFTSFRAGGYGGGNLGIRYDAAGFLYPGSMQMGWIEFFNRKAGLGLYYANHDVESRLTGLYLELRPFTKSAVVGSNWPTPADVPAGEPIGLTMGWLKFPYLKRGTFASGPVALQIHRGDWHEGSALYRAWFDRHFEVHRPPSWLRREMAWQSVIISNSEDVAVWKFKDLPKLAADARKYGVTTFEILGWDIGGIDRGYPQYRPDPRLGTAGEFRQALAEMKKLGVHPLIFANVQFADTATPLFTEKLRKFAVHGRWAEDLPLMGWGEGTISARMGLTTSNMTVLSPAHPEFRKSLLDQFARLVEDGAAGFQLDKTNAVAFLDFNPALPTSPDKSFTQELLSTFDEVVRRCRAVNPEFALASEILWDRSFPWVDVSYVRMGEIDMSSAALRFTFPEWTSTICAESPGDINVMNNGMRYGLVWAMQPRHYNDSMDEPLTRPLSRYVQELIRIRNKHKTLLFHGRFRDTLGAEVKAGPEVRYSVFEGLDTPGKACVVVNFGNGENEAEVSWPGGTGRAVEILKPFEPDRTAVLPVKIRLAPRSCAVVVLK
ncbi:MAG: DUF6259 domain-containing protein [Candidatus Aminicenantales bacterium]